jgi:hypothetical protein
MKTTSSWLSAAVLSAIIAVPAVAGAQMRPSTTMDRILDRREQAERAARIEQARNRVERSQQRSCNGYTKHEKRDKKLCKELRKEEKRLAKARKHRELCARNSNPRFCRDDQGTLSDIFLGRDGSSRGGRTDGRIERRPGIHIPGMRF